MFVFHCILHVQEDSPQLVMKNSGRDLALEIYIYIYNLAEHWKKYI